MSEEIRFVVRCLGSKKKNKKREEEITDNGLQFMPLTGYNQNSYGKEVYAWEFVILFFYVDSKMEETGF